MADRNPFFFGKNLSFPKRLAFFISTAGGAGFSPFAPGTAGSLIGAILYFWAGRLSICGQFILMALFLGAALWAARETERFTGKHDDGRIVVDEVVGMWVTLAAFPPTVGWIAIGFLVFRVLDIFKPFPADTIDRKWPGARGVIFDDVVSGIYGQAVLRVIERLLVFL